MVGMHATEGRERICAGGKDVRDDVPELSELVAAKSQPRVAVLPFCSDFHSIAGMGGEAGHWIA